MKTIRTLGNIWEHFVRAPNHLHCVPAHYSLPAARPLRFLEARIIVYLCCEQSLLVIVDGVGSCD